MKNTNTINSLYNTALQLISNENNTQAIQTLQQCVSIDKQETDSLLLLGKIFLQPSQINNALSVYTQAKSIKKFEIEAIVGIAKIHRISKNEEHAYQFIHQEIKSHKPNVDFILALSEICIELGRYSEAIQKIENLLSISNIKSIDKKKNLLHTLGKLYDKDENYEKTFKYHKMANEQTPDQYNPLNFKKTISNIQSTYSNNFLNSCHFSKVKNKQPVFIIGMPRSGSSLIEQILSCHSNIHAAGELSTIQLLIARMCKGQYPKQMRNISSKILSNSTQYYINKVCSKNHVYTTDKMPHNYLHVGVIHQLFPDSKIINISRNPIDNCISIYFQYFNNTHRYATNLSNIAHHYAGYRTLLKHWKDQLPEKIIDIHYEELVNNTQQEITKVLDFLGLEWQEICLHHHKSKRHVITASQQQVNKPIYSQSIKRWKHYEAFISPLLSDLKSHNLI